MCLEGRSCVKTPRVLQEEQKGHNGFNVVREIEDDELYFEAYDDMVKFFAEKTNCSNQM